MHTDQGKNRLRKVFEASLVNPLVCVCCIVFAGCAPSRAPPEAPPPFATGQKAPVAQRLQCPVVETDRCWGVTVAKDLYFRSGAAVLDQASRGELDGFIAKLKTVRYVIMVRIRGHTDATGMTAANLRLSERRANTVSNYLVAQWPDMWNRIEVRAEGQTTPVADNHTTAGRAKNRRVEIEAYVGCTPGELEAYVREGREAEQCRQNRDRQ